MATLPHGLLFLVDAAASRRRMQCGLLDIVKEVAPPEAERVRVGVFSGPDLHDMGALHAKLKENFGSEVKILDCKIDSVQSRTSSDTGRAEWLLLCMDIKGKGVAEVKARDTLSVPHVVHNAPTRCEPADKVSQLS